MSINKLGGTNSDNWELISAVTPTVASAAVNFTGLTPYRKLMVTAVGIVLGTNGNIAVRLNNDSTSNRYGFQFFSSTDQVFSFSDAITFTGAGNTQKMLSVIFTDCDTTGVKILQNGAGAGGVGLSGDIRIGFNGIYLASAAITQVNVITNTTFTAVGTVSLYGVK